MRVAHHLDVLGARDSLVLGPSGHHRAVVHTVDNHLIDAERLELVSIVLVARDLAAGSGGRKCAGQAHQYHLLARDAVGDVDLLRREAKVQLDVWDCRAHLELSSDEREQHSPHWWLEWERASSPLE